VRAPWTLLAGLVLSACGSGDASGGSVGESDAPPAVAEDAPTALGGQGSTAEGVPYPGAEPSLTPEERERQLEMMMEIQAIDRMLGPIRDRAIGMPDMAARQQALQTRIETAMEAAAPGTIEKRVRFDSLVLAYEEAQQSRDEAALQSLGIELQGLQLDLGQAQQQALADPEIRAEMQAFRDDLFARMREIDPVADSLFDRGDALNAELEVLVGGN